MGHGGVQDGFGSEHKSRRGGVTVEGGKGGWEGRREGMNQLASPPFVVQMSPVTVKGERA